MAADVSVHIANVRACKAVTRMCGSEYCMTVSSQREMEDVLTSLRGDAVYSAREFQGHKVLNRIEHSHDGDH